MAKYNWVGSIVAEKWKRDKSYNVIDKLNYAYEKTEIVPIT